MRYLYLFPLLLCVLFCIACSDDDNSRSFTGFGTVEMNDSVVAVHYYDYILVAEDASPFAELADGSRVYFECRAKIDESDESETTFFARFHTLSPDISCGIINIYSDEVQASDSLLRLSRSPEGFQAKNIHVARDWRLNDYLNATAIYPGATDSTDRDMFGYVRSRDEDGSIVLWLRLCRFRRDSSVYVTRHISVPVKSLRDSTKERVYLKLKRINYNGDTVCTDFVYSYANFVD